MTILERFEELHPESKRLHDRATKVFPDGVTHDIRYFQPFPLYVERSDGAYKWDVDGNTIIDFINGHGSLLLGHNYPTVRDAVAKQVGRGTHYGASHEAEIDWAQRVTELIPSAESVRFTSSGTEATMMAVRLARAFTGRQTLVRFSQNFHGWNDNMVGVPDREGVHPHALGVPDETLSNVVVVPQNDPDTLRQTLREEDVAAVILEPTGAHFGAIPLDEAMLPMIREETASTGSVLIFDEVVTGFRASPGGVQAARDITPDMTTLAKILAGGLPGGAVCGRAEIFNAIEFASGRDFEDRVPHPGTYNANPLSSAAGNAALEMVATGEPHRHTERLCRDLVVRLNGVLQEESIVGCAYAHTSMFHLIIGNDCSPPIDDFSWNWADQPSDRVPGTPGKAAWALRRGMINEGVELMGMGGMVSFAHSPNEIDHTIQAFQTTISTMKAEGLI
jgi:glutamate-1-semialdehyde 2,1-aminomutase